MTPMWPCREISDSNGYMPIECFVHVDTTGKELSCKDIFKLRQIQHGKKMVNLQIQMWVETTVENPLILMPQEIKEITKNYPEWVFNSYIRRVSKLMQEKEGFIPTYVKKFLPV